jgi:hypothetical protein
LNMRIGVNDSILYIAVPPWQHFHKQPSLIQPYHVQPSGWVKQPNPIQQSPVRPLAERLRTLDRRGCGTFVRAGIWGPNWRRRVGAGRRRRRNRASRAMKTMKAFQGRYDRWLSSYSIYAYKLIFLMSMDPSSMIVPHNGTPLHFHRQCLILRCLFYNAHSIIHTPRVLQCLACPALQCATP